VAAGFGGGFGWGGFGGGIVSEMFVDHIPFAPPRENTPAEGIYLKLWQDFAAARPDDFQDIFRDMNDTVDQRIASVAASFMVYMGCNVGHAFTERAKALIHVFAWERESYLAAWAIHNRRTYGVNNGLRAVEFMLATQHPIDNEGCRHVVWERIPEIAQKEMDAVECMVEWWSTGPAKRMRGVAESLIEAERRKAMSNLFTPQEVTD
jgi:hypothetical protein